MATIENLTIMFTDIVGFSNMVSSLSRNDSERLLKQHDRLLKKIIKRFCGEIVKSVGDSFLVIFRSPTDSVLCSMAMQDALWEFNQNQPDDKKIIIRIALNTGEVRLTHNDVFGEAVNIASRLESTTPAGCIYLTETVYLSMNRNEVEFRTIGEEQFKGIPQPLMIYQALHKKTADVAIDNEIDQYPYGGAHLHLKPANRSLFTVGKIFVGLSAGLIAAVLSWGITMAYMPGPTSLQLDKVEVEYRQTDSITENDVAAFATDITTEIRSLADPLLNNKNYLQLKELIKTYNSDYADNPYLQSLQGHVDMYEKNYESAAKNYQIALKNNPALARDPLLSANLVQLLDSQRLIANRLIARYLSQPMLTELAKRSGEAGLRGRYDAFYLLKDSGNANKVDRIGLNIWDLRELEECSLKKIAVQELKRLNDPRALPALKEAMDVGIFKRFKYMCYRQEAQAAIEQLEKKPSDTNDTNPS